MQVDREDKSSSSESSGTLDSPMTWINVIRWTSNMNEVEFLVTPVIWDLESDLFSFPWSNKMHSCYFCFRVGYPNSYPSLMCEERWDR